MPISFYEALKNPPPTLAGARANRGRDRQDRARTHHPRKHHEVFKETVGSHPKKISGPEHMAMPAKTQATPQLLL